MAGDIGRDRDSLIKLHEINRLRTQEMDEQKILETILDQLILLTLADRGFILLRTKTATVVKAARNIGKEMVSDPAFKVSRGIIDEVMSTGKPVLVDCALEDSEFGARQTVQGLKLASVACVPMRLQDHLVGALYLDNRSRRGLFRADLVMLLETYAHEASAVVQRARLVKRVLELEEELKVARRPGETRVRRKP